MSVSLRGQRFKIGLLCMGLLMGEAMSGPARAAETVNITIPASVTFTVTNSGAVTVTGSPNPFIISYTSLNLNGNGRQLRIGVIATSAAFSPTNGTSIPANKISWTINSATNGTGFGGTLSSLSYSPVFYGNHNPTSSSGNVSLTWKLNGINTGVRAGTYTLNLRWGMDAFSP